MGIRRSRKLHAHGEAVINLLPSRSDLGRIPLYLASTVRVSFVLRPESGLSNHLSTAPAMGSPRFAVNVGFPHPMRCQHIILVIFENILDRGYLGRLIPRQIPIDFVALGRV